MKLPIGPIAGLCLFVTGGVVRAQDHPRAPTDSGPHISNEFVVGVRETLWLPSVTGDMEGDAGRVEGSHVSFAHDLDIDSPAVVPITDLDFDLWGTWRVQASYWIGVLNGDATTDRALTFEGTALPAGTHLSTDMHLHRGEVMVSRTFVFPGQATALNRLEAGLGAKVFSFDTEVSSRTGGRVGSVNGVLALPVVGARAEFLFYEDSTWTAGAEVAVDAMSLPLGNNKALTVETYGELNASWKRRVFAGIGYRYFEFDGRMDEKPGSDVYDLRMQGLTLSVTVWF